MDYGEVPVCSAVSAIYVSYVQALFISLNRSSAFLRTLTDFRPRGAKSWRASGAGERDFALAHGPHGPYRKRVRRPQGPLEPFQGMITSGVIYS